MKKRIIIYISIFSFLTAIILSNMNELQNKKDIDGGLQQVKGQSQDEAVDLFIHLPVNW